VACWLFAASGTHYIPDSRVVDWWFLTWLVKFA